MITHTWSASQTTGLSPSGGWEGRWMGVGLEGGLPQAQSRGRTLSTTGI